MRAPTFLRDEAPERSARRFEGDGGAVIAEAALGLPILLMILCGIVDFGGAWRTQTGMQGAVRVAARTAANTGSDDGFKQYADQYAMTALWAGIANIENITVTKAIVYKPSSFSSPDPSAGCKGTSPGSGGAGINGVCNVYSKNQIENANVTWSQSNAACSSGWDRYYCTRTRGNKLTSPPDYLGIYVQVTYTPYTGMFGTTFQMDDQEVVRIEPTPA